MKGRCEEEGGSDSKAKNDAGGMNPLLSPFFPSKESLLRT